LPARDKSISFFSIVLLLWGDFFSRNTPMKASDFTPLAITKQRSPGTPGLKLEDGSRIAVIGGGPSGSFFSYFLLDMAERVDLELRVDIYEPRDFSLPAPQGCNHCAGVISETLLQNLATEGINLPLTVVQRGIDSYVMHTDVGSLRIETPFHEKRIAALFRSAGPRGIQNSEWVGFDEHLLSLAKDKAAQVIKARVTEVERHDGRLVVKTRNAPPQIYDLLSVGTGVNSQAIKLFDDQEFNYKPPSTTKTAIHEYFIGADSIEKYFGSSLHVFLLDIPKLDFAMIVPKGDYVAVCLLGSDIDEALFQKFLNFPEVKSCFPHDWRGDQPACKCFPRINVRGATQPFADRVVFIGDSGVTRLYKDGIGAAYRAAKAAATTAIFEGISANDFKKHYWPMCRAMNIDNWFGRFIFTITHVVQRRLLLRQAVLLMATQEQQEGYSPRMSSVLWDTFTGSAPYKDIFLRTFHPAFLSRLIWDLSNSFIDNRFVDQDDLRTTA
jgi:flavin-dependent dehydrogenase